MTNLAIKGHKTRGDEVIELLEMLGGTNKWEYVGDRDCIYYINKQGSINYTSILAKKDFKIFSLEEFLEKYPYKVGDKVNYIIYDKNHSIISVCWDGRENEIVYELDNNEYVFVEYLQPCKEQEIMEKDSILNQLIEYMKNTPRDIIEKEWHEYDKYNEIGPTVKEYLESINKPKYPKTYDECCKVLFLHSIELGKVLTSGYNCVLLKKLGELLICRDAYWKIVGKELGLGKPWEPDWNDTSQIKHSIWFDNNGMCLKSNRTSYAVQHVLAFPTIEMREIFYENFKELIEECKKLL